MGVTTWQSSAKSLSFYWNSWFEMRFQEILDFLVFCDEFEKKIWRDILNERTQKKKTWMKHEQQQKVQLNKAITG